VRYLDEYATRQFEAILHYMVGTHNEVKPSEGVIHLLVNSGMMERQYVVFLRKGGFGVLSNPVTVVPARP
jgi:Transcription factor Tfb2